MDFSLSLLKASCLFLSSYWHLPAPPLQWTEVVGSQPPWLDWAMPSRDASSTCLGLLFWFEVSRGTEKGTDKNTTNQRQPELLGTTLLILFPGKDKSLMEFQTKGRTTAKKKKGMMDSSHLKPSNNSPTCSNLSRAPLSSMHSSLKKKPHPHHKKTTLKCFLGHRVHLG